MKVKWDKQYFMKHMMGLPTFTEEQVKDVLFTAGLKKYYVDPATGDTVFEVDHMPDNKLLIGLKWVEFVAS